MRKNSDRFLPKVILLENDGLFKYQFKINFFILQFFLDYPHNIIWIIIVLEEGAPVEH